MLKPKLRVLAAARRPFARAFAVQPHANADVRLDAHLLRDPQRLLQLLEFFDDDDDRLAEPAAEHGGANEGAVLVAVADDEALRVFVHRERGDQLRFAAGFETEMKLRAGVDDLFDHFAQLIDLDRKNAAIFVAITELLHRRVKGAVDRLDPVPQQILEPDHERKTESALARFVHHFEQIDRAAGVL